MMNPAYQLNSEDLNFSILVKGLIRSILSVKFIFLYSFVGEKYDFILNGELIFCNNEFSKELKFYLFDYGDYSYLLFSINESKIYIIIYTHALI